MAVAVAVAVAVRQLARSAVVRLHQKQESTLRPSLAEVVERPEAHQKRMGVAGSWS